MTEELIDSFIEAKSSLELTKDPESREELYNVLAFQIRSQWEEFTTFSEKKESALTLPTEQEAFDQRVGAVQQLCAQTIQHLEQVPANGFLETDLFQAKEMALQLTGGIEAFKQYYG